MMIMNNKITSMLVEICKTSSNGSFGEHCRAFFLECFNGLEENLQNLISEQLDLIHRFQTGDATKNDLLVELKNIWKRVDNKKISGTQKELQLLTLACMKVDRNEDEMMEALLNFVEKYLKISKNYTLVETLLWGNFLNQKK